VEDGAHLVLVGLPGSGKSTCGRLAAAKLACPFIDLDERIELLAGTTIAAVFHAEGEVAFRRLEHLVTRQIATEPRAIVATGGGWIESPANAGALRPTARRVYLRISPQGAAVRLGAAGSAIRPLLSGTDPAAEIAQLLARRMVLYEAAECTIDVEGVSPQQVAEWLVELALRPVGPLG
jgi:shikimate kinase